MNLLSRLKLFPYHRSLFYQVSQNSTLFSILGLFFYAEANYLYITYKFSSTATVQTMSDPETVGNNAPSQKRSNYLEWDDYFMATAFLAAKRSKDPVTQVGACIVDEDSKIVGVGYNGMPIGCNDDEFPWGKSGGSELESKFLYVCHAEMNAILNKNSATVKNCKMYVALFPCNECAKFIIQSGIKEVIYMSDKNAHKTSTIASKKMLDACGVKYRQFIPKMEKIVIDFGQINWSVMNQLPATPKK